MLDLELIRKKQEELYAHPLLTGEAITNNEQLLKFMEYHVFNVWDFMSLVKSLQKYATCVSVPWRPAPVPRYITRFINEIVLEEESDTDMRTAGSNHTEYVGHYDLYLRAMEELGYNTRRIRNFVENFDYNDCENWGIPRHCADFITSTFDFIGTQKPHVVAAAFAFGREAIIPAMFTKVLKQLNISEATAPTFHYYLERHIEVDGGSHGEYAVEMVKFFCGDDPVKGQEATEAAIRAIEHRQKYWSRVEAKLARPHNIFPEEESY